MAHLKRKFGAKERNQKLLLRVKLNLFAIKVSVLVIEALQRIGGLLFENSFTLGRGKRRLPIYNGRFIRSRFCFSLIF